jgi:phosphoribosyl 1,2-cyclic phosphodiesterase
MAEFLDQEEIDALLDVADDCDVNEKDRALDEASIGEIGATKFPGTKSDNLQDIKEGNSGYIHYKKKYGSETFEKLKVVQISDSGNIAVLTDVKLDSIKVKVSEIQDRFYKDDVVYEMNMVKKAYVEMVEKLDTRFGMSVKEFFDEVKRLKKDYPEIWL